MKPAKTAAAIIRALLLIVVFFAADKLSFALRNISTVPLSQTFKSLKPSFQPVDILIAAFITGLLALAIFAKQKKNYRHGVEHGSARWGTAADIKPYVDPDRENNIILTATESLTMNDRPANPETARNKNVLIVGGSGSGKTRFWLKPNLLQMHSSYVVTDPKRAVF